MTDSSSEGRRSGSGRAERLSAPSPADTRVARPALATPVPCAAPPALCGAPEGAPAAREGCGADPAASHLCSERLKVHKVITLCRVKRRMPNSTAEDPTRRPPPPPQRASCRSCRSPKRHVSQHPVAGLTLLGCQLHTVSRNWDCISHPLVGHRARMPGDAGRQRLAADPSQIGSAALSSRIVLSSRHQSAFDRPYSRQNSSAGSKFQVAPCKPVSCSLLSVTRDASH